MDHPSQNISASQDPIHSAISLNPIRPFQVARCAQAQTIQANTNQRRVASEVCARSDNHIASRRGLGGSYTRNNARRAHRHTFDLGSTTGQLLQSSSNTFQVQSQTPLSSRKLKFKVAIIPCYVELYSFFL